MLKLACKVKTYFKKKKLCRQMANFFEVIVVKIIWLRTTSLIPRVWRMRDKVGEPEPADIYHCWEYNWVRTALCRTANIFQQSEANINNPGMLATINTNVSYLSISTSVLQWTQKYYPLLCWEMQCKAMLHHPKEHHTVDSKHRE